jgi:hypothetical protein
MEDEILFVFQYVSIRLFWVWITLFTGRFGQLSLYFEHWLISCRAFLLHQRGLRLPQSLEELIVIFFQLLVLNLKLKYFSFQSFDAARF